MVSRGPSPLPARPPSLRLGGWRSALLPAASSQHSPQQLRLQYFKEPGVSPRKPGSAGFRPRRAGDPDPEALLPRASALLAQTRSTGAGAGLGPSAARLGRGPGRAPNGDRGHLCPSAVSARMRCSAGFSEDKSSTWRGLPPGPETHRTDAGGASWAPGTWLPRAATGHVFLRLLHFLCLFRSVSPRMGGPPGLPCALGAEGATIPSGAIRSEPPEPPHVWGRRAGGRDADQPLWARSCAVRRLRGVVGGGPARRKRP